MIFKLFQQCLMLLFSYILLFKTNRQNKIASLLQVRPKICSLWTLFTYINSGTFNSSQKWYANNAFFFLKKTLFWNNFRLTEKLQKQNREFLYTLHIAFFNVNILIRHSIIIKTNKLT